MDTATLNPAPDATRHLPELAGHRCRLRPLQPGDAESLTAQADDPEVTRYLHDDFDVRAWCTSDLAPVGGHLWAIEVAPNQPPAGFLLVLCQRAPFHCNAEIGYWLAPAHWGRGIATEALAMATAWAWGNVPSLTRIVLDVFVGNVASAHVAARVGYRVEALLPRSAMKGGRAIDRLQFAMYRD